MKTVYCLLFFLPFLSFSLSAQSKRDLRLTISKLVGQKDSIIEELEYSKKIIDSTSNDNKRLKDSIRNLSSKIKSNNQTMTLMAESYYHYIQKENDLALKLIHDVYRRNSESEYLENINNLLIKQESEYENNGIDSINSDFDDFFLSVDYDEFRELYYHIDNRTDRFKSNGKSEFYIEPYIVSKKENDTHQIDNLLAKFMFRSDDWLFVSKVIIKIGSEKYEFTGKVKTDNSSSTTIEWFDQEIKFEFLKEIVKEFEDTGNVKIRFIGDTYNSDFEFSKVQIAGMKNFLKYYTVLK